MTNPTSGKRIASRIAPDATMATPKPRRWMPTTRAGTITMPPTLAPVSASVIARAWRLRNHGSSVALRLVELRQAQPVASNTYTAKSCHNAVICPSRASAPAIAQTP